MQLLKSDREDAKEAIQKEINATLDELRNSTGETNTTIGNTTDTAEGTNATANTTHEEEPLPPIVDGDLVAL